MTSTPQPDSVTLYESLEPYLTSVRLSPYLAYMQGNRRKAIQLYQWNVGLSGAMHEALHVFEMQWTPSCAAGMLHSNARMVADATVETGLWIRRPYLPDLYQWAT